MRDTDFVELKGCPHYSGRGGHLPRLVVMHGDASPSAIQTANWLADPASKVSYHYLIARDGSVMQFVPEQNNAWHAGKSTWKDYGVGNSVNKTSVGVSLSNDGTGHEVFTPAQYESAGRLVAGICHRWDIRIWDIVGHNEVSPARKLDPWDWFDWVQFYGHFGYFAAGR